MAPRRQYKSGEAVENTTRSTHNHDGDNGDDDVSLRMREAAAWVVLLLSTVLTILSFLIPLYMPSFATNNIPQTICTTYASASSTTAQSALVKNILDVAFLGNYSTYTRPADMGILHAGLYNGHPVDLFPFFNGCRPSSSSASAKWHGRPADINLLDPTRPLSGRFTHRAAQARIRQQMDRYFAGVIGCDLAVAGADKPHDANGFTAMTDVEVGYFTRQIEHAMVFVGVSAASAHAVGVHLRNDLRRATPTATNDENTNGNADSQTPTTAAARVDVVMEGRLHPRQDGIWHVPSHTVIPLSEASRRLATRTRSSSSETSTELSITTAPPDSPIPNPSDPATPLPPPAQESTSDLPASPDVPSSTSTSTPTPTSTSLQIPVQTSTSTTTTVALPISTSAEEAGSETTSAPSSTGSPSDSSDSPSDTPAPASAPGDGGGGGGGSSNLPAAIAGGVGGGLAVVLIAGIVAWLVIRRRRQRQWQRQQHLEYGASSAPELVKEYGPMDMDGQEIGGIDDSDANGGYGGISTPQPERRGTPDVFRFFRK